MTRLAATLYTHFGAPPGGRALLDVGVIGARGMRLRAGGPGSIPYELESRQLDEDSIRAEPHEVPVEVLVERPDALAWRALTALYFAIGLLPDRMPRDVYDERHERVHFPK